MADQPEPTAEEREPAVTSNVNGGINIQSGHDVSIGGDVIGRDKVSNTTTRVTNIGMSPDAVRRLVIAVGAMVFVTAFCFFASGAVAGAAALSAFQRELPSTPEAAGRFQAQLKQIDALPAGQQFEWQMIENDLSSYIRFMLGPPIGFDGRARFLPSQQIAFSGPWSGVGNRPVMVVMTVQTNSDQLFKIDRASVQILPLGVNFGWVPVPASVVQPLVDAINADIGSGFVATSAQYPPFVERNGQQWPDGPLTIHGVAK